MSDVLDEFVGLSSGVIPTARLAGDSFEQLAVLSCFARFPVKRADDETGLRRGKLGCLFRSRPARGQFNSIQAVFFRPKSAGITLEASLDRLPHWHVDRAS